MDWFVAAVIIGLAMLLIWGRSTYIVDYALAVYVFNRGLRRFLDWMSGSFQPLSPLSLTPLIVFGVMLIPFLGRYSSLPRSLQTIFKCLFVALGYSFIIGFFHIGFGAIYALAEAIAPVAVFGFVMTTETDQAVKDRWLRSAAWCAVLASAYGWYQYYTIPEWDAFWVRSVGFEGYMGELKPTKMTVFSTMAERGPFGSFLGFALVPMVISSRWRTILGWPAVVLVFSALLLSLTRTGIIVAVLSILIFVMVNRGSGFTEIAIAFGVIALALTFGLGKISGSDKFSSRLNTLSNIQNDGSYQGRLYIYQVSALSVLGNPLGTGLGSTGLAGRVNSGSLAGSATITDAGYLEIPATYGWLGAGLLVSALWRMWKEMALRYKVGYRPTELLLGRALLLALIPACFVGNVITQFSILWIVFGVAIDPRAFLAFCRMKAAIEKRSSPLLRPRPS